MSQKDKELLLKDLCARLHYGVMYQVDDGAAGLNDGKLVEIDTSKELARFEADYYWDAYIDNVKPYLRPMSSMTEEEFNELHELCPHSVFNATNVPGWIVGINGSDYGRIARTDEIMVFIDWLNKNMFDYRGLIEKGLALMAPKGMYKIEK